MANKDTMVTEMPPIVAAKMAAFDLLLPEFEVSFPYMLDMQGQRRFERLEVAGVVRYLHALWVCERKDLLLSVPHTIRRYEGSRALQLLAAWQQGEVAEVVAFLQARLDALPFAEITRQWQVALRDTDTHRAERLSHGRRVLLNRGFNLHVALDALFTPPLSELLALVRVAGEELGHTPKLVARQLAEMGTEVYSYYPHPALGRRNMLLMNALGVQVTDNAADTPGNRTWKVEHPTVPAGPYAQTLIVDAVQLLPSPHSTYAYFPDEDAVGVAMGIPPEQGIVGQPSAS